MKMRRLVLSAVLLIGVNYAIYRYRFAEKPSEKTSEIRKHTWVGSFREEESDSGEIFTTSTSTKVPIELTSTKSPESEESEETSTTKGTKV